MIIFDLTSVSHALTVAERGSFNRAAHTLGVRQSAVSRRIRALEDDIGVSLFERGGGGVRKTIAGHEFLEQARSILENLERAAQKARRAGEGRKGELQIGTQVSLNDEFLLKLISGFTKICPDVAVGLIDLFDEKFHQFIDDRRLDLIFRTVPTHERDFCEERLWERPVHVVLPKNHQLADKRALSWQDIRTERFLARRYTSSERMVIEAFRKRGWDPVIDAFSLNREDLFSLIGLGRGIMVTGPAPTLAARPDLVSRPLRRNQAKVEFFALWSDKNDNPALRRFISLARARKRMSH